LQGRAQVYYLHPFLQLLPQPVLKPRRLAAAVCAHALCRSSFPATAAARPAAAFVTPGITLALQMLLQLHSPLLHPLQAGTHHINTLRGPPGA
jgi:hypothetical protein